MLYEGELKRRQSKKLQNNELIYTYGITVIGIAFGAISMNLSDFILLVFTDYDLIEPMDFAFKTFIILFVIGTVVATFVYLLLWIVGNRPDLVNETHIHLQTWLIGQIIYAIIITYSMNKLLASMIIVPILQAIIVLLFACCITAKKLRKYDIYETNRYPPRVQMMRFNAVLSYVFGLIAIGNMPLGLILITCQFIVIYYIPL